MPYRAFYAYPWDLPSPRGGEDLGTAVARWLESHGLNALTLAASYHAGRFLRPQGSPAVVFPEDGTVYFQPRLERYGRMKPLPDTRYAAWDPFRTLPGHGTFPLTAWLVLLHNTRLGTLHPEYVVRNAYGDAYPYSLCPSHSEVRDYAVALCADVSEGRTLAGLALETPGWLGFTHGWHHEFQQVEPNGWLQALMGLCFCDGCMAGSRHAGISGIALRQRIQHHLSAFLQGPAAPSESMAQAWFTADLAMDGELTAFLKWRCDQVTSLVRAIRQAVPRQTRVHVIATCQKPHAMAFLEGHDLAALHAACDGLELPLYQPSPAAVVADLWDTRRRLQASTAPRVILRPGPPDMTGPGQLAATLQGLQAQGIEDVSFYNAGLLRPLHLEWLQQTLHPSEPCPFH